ncbi:hypothetical protein HDU96_003809 [Phlyctochytrium bullatum]|nr:hypothetical protein HDU96_003809 [Phlyctochytrium bullatum]
MVMDSPWVVDVFKAELRREAAGLEVWGMPPRFHAAESGTAMQVKPGNSTLAGEASCASQSAAGKLSVKAKAGGGMRGCLRGISGTGFNANGIVGASGDFPGAMAMAAETPAAAVGGQASAATSDDDRMRQRGGGVG